MTRRTVMLTTVGDEPPEQPSKKPELFRDYLNVGTALSVPPPDLDFVFPGLLAGTMGVLVSPGGAGKSMWGLGTAVSVAAGRDLWQLLGSDPKPGPVLIVSVEDPADILIRRLHALASSAPTAFQDPEMIARLHVKAVHGKNWALGTWNGSSFVASEELEVLALEIEQLRPRLVVFDTLNRCLAGISENDNAAMGRVISEVERVMAPTKSAALVLHHTSKATALQGQGNAQQAARGASAITDNARWQMNLVTMDPKEAEQRGIQDEDRRQWVQATVTKVNYAAPLPDCWLRREAGGVLVAGTPPAAKPSNGKQRRQDDGALPTEW